MTLDQFTVQSADGTAVPLDHYRGQVVLVVNVASACGFTPQYAGLEQLQRKYQERGFSVLAFPCNQFGEQEPGSAEEIARFCETNYQVSFPIFDKVDVNGPDASPLWTWLKEERPGILGTTAIKWNFTKFLVSRRGVVCKRFGSQTTPEEIEPEIVARLTDDS
ncbi:MAG: glutathione peroxidase [Gemmatimonadota bacterium]